jgi:hypothetical protein
MAADRQVDIVVKATDLASGVYQQVSESTRKFAGDVQAAGGSIQGATQQTSAFRKALDDLKPSTDNAGASFTDLKTTLTDVWEHPTEKLGQFAQALSSDLTSAAGGASSSLGGMAVAAGAAAAGLAVAGGVALELAERAAKIGGELNDMSEKTGISVAALSNLKYAVDVAGGSLEQVSNGIFMFQRNLGEGSDKVVQGLGRIGLSIEQIEAMSPDQQFLAIAEGIQHVEDPSQRAAAAMELFGKQGREMLPLLMKPLQELTEQSRELGFTWSNEEAKAAEEFEMQTRALGLQLSKMGVDMGRDLLPAVHDFVSLLQWAISHKDDIHNAFSLFGVTGVKGPAEDLQETSRQIGLQLEEMVGKVKMPTLNLGAAAGASKDDLALAWLQLDASTKQYRDDVRRTEEEQRKWNELLAEFATVGSSAMATIEQLDGAVVQGVQYYLQQGVAVEKIAKLYGLTTEQVHAVSVEMKFEQSVIDETTKIMGAHLAQVGLVAARYGDLHKALEDISSDPLHAYALALDVTAGKTESVEEMSQKYRDALHQVRAELEAVAGKQFGFGKAIDATIESVPHIIQSALTGGGGMNGAVQAIGSNLGANLGKSIVGAIPGSMTSLFGETAGAALDIALPGIGGAIGSLVGPLLGKLFSIGGPSQEELQGRDVERQFEQSFGGFNQMMDAVGKAYAATGRSAQQAQADVAGLLAAEKQGGDAAKAWIDKINGAFTEQQQDAEDLKTAIDKYHFSIEELGPAMKKQALDDQAKTILNDWRLLAGSGIDVATVDKHMAQSIQEYLNLAKKTGEEVPEAMKPIIQSLIDNGDLLDENGNKITDMGQLGITWSETMTQGFDRVVDKLQQVIDSLNKAGHVIDDIPDHKDIDVRTHYSSDGSPGPRSDAGDGGEPEKMAAGGFRRVTRPTLFLVGEDGPEDAWFSGSGRTMAQRLGVGSPAAPIAAPSGSLVDASTTRDRTAQPKGDVTFNFSLPVQAQIFDPTAMDRLVRDYILPALHELWRQSGGARRDTRVSLGVS